MSEPGRADGWSASGPLSTGPGALAAAVVPTVATITGPGSPVPPDPAPAADLGADPRRPAAAPLAPRFPGPAAGTGVVLYGSAAGALRAHWRLAPDDQARGGGQFPAGEHPLPVVRLCRVDPGGGAEAVQQAALVGVARAGVGETGFAVAADHGRYRVELGLTTGDGGWLLLARSNELDNVSAVGRDLATLERAPDASARVSPPAPAPVTTAPVAPLDPGAAREPALGAPPPDPLVRVFPLVPGALSLAAGVAQHALEGRPLRLRSPAGDGAPPPAPSPAAALAEPVRLGPVATRSYGQAPGAVAGAQVEAELRITGQAPPGSLIDLFGFPFRVGPGGRFQLVVRVTDPSLLHQALALEPPPELTLTRDP